MKKLLHPSMQLLFFAVLNMLFAFAYQIILARQLDVSTYGYLITVIAISLLISSIATAGVPGFLLRVFGAEGEFANRWVYKSFICVLLTYSFLVVMFQSGFGESFTTLIKVLIFSLVASQICYELVTAKFQIEGKYSNLAVWQLILNGLRTIVFIGLIMLGFELSQDVFVCGLVLSSITVIIISILFLSEGIIPNNQPSQTFKRLELGSETFINIFSHSLPFAASGFLYLVYFQSDIILIKYMLNDSYAGLYNVAFITMAAIFLIPSVIYQKFLLPKLHYLAANDFEKFIQIYLKGSRYMAGLGVGLMLLVMIISPIIIPIVFGVEFRLTVSLLMILAVAIPFRFIASSATGLMIERKAMKSKVKIMFYVAIMNIVLNIMFIPIYGVYGAAVTTLLSEVLLCLLFYRFINKNIVNLSFSDNQ